MYIKRLITLRYCWRQRSRRQRLLLINTSGGNRKKELPFSPSTEKRGVQNITCFIHTITLAIWKHYVLCVYEWVSRYSSNPLIPWIHAWAEGSSFTLFLSQYCACQCISSSCSCCMCTLFSFLSETGDMTFDEGLKECTVYLVILLLAAERW